MKAIVYPELTPAGPQRWTLTVDGVQGEVIMRDGLYGAFIGETFVGTFTRPGVAGAALQEEIRGYIDVVDVEDDE